MAATYCARLLNKPIVVVVPESTPAVVVKKLEDDGADVMVFGKVLTVSTVTIVLFADHALAIIHWEIYM